MRFCAVAIAGVLTIGLMTDTLRAYFESQAPGMLNSLAAPQPTRDQLISELSGHPLFESARRFRELILPPMIRLCARFPGVAAGVATSGRALGSRGDDPAVERLRSLMTANNATHVDRPLSRSHRLFVLAVPVISPIRPPKPHSLWCDDCWH